MDAITLLKDDHDGLKTLLNKGDETTERAIKTRMSLLQQIGTQLIAHEKIEEDIFYPALKKHPKAKDIVLEGYQEHHVVDLIMGELEHTEVTDEKWGAKFSVMKENMEHHIEEEEGEMFKTARSVFTREELVELGERMHKMKAEILTAHLVND